MHRIIEQEKELRSRKAESSLWSEAAGDSKVKRKKHWSDKRKVSHQKIATTNKIILQVSLANSKAVFDLRVKPSKSALDQSSFPWQVDITLIMMTDNRMVISRWYWLWWRWYWWWWWNFSTLFVNERNSAVGKCQIYLNIKLAAPSYSSPWAWLWAGDRDCKYYHWTEHESFIHDRSNFCERESCCHS